MSERDRIVQIVDSVLRGWRDPEDTGHALAADDIADELAAAGLTVPEGMTAALMRDIADNPSLVGRTVLRKWADALAGIADGSSGDGLPTPSPFGFPQRKKTQMSDRATADEVRAEWRAYREAQAAAFVGRDSLARAIADYRNTTLLAPFVSGVEQRDLDLADSLLERFDFAVRLPAGIADTETPRHE